MASVQDKRITGRSLKTGSRVDKLEYALSVAIEFIEEILGDDRESSQTLAFLKFILSEGEEVGGVDS